MNIIMKKKKYKFNVNISVEQLSSVPFVNAVLFAKCRLLDGGRFVDHTDCREVEDHCVKWNKSFMFTCKMSANASTGLLDSCILRLSIRKETKGGKSFVKLGYADINLASFPGAGLTNCRCLLEGYESRHHRQDNSMLHFKVELKLLSGDPCFKTPKFTCMTQNHKQGGNDSELLDPTVLSESDPSHVNMSSANSGDSATLQSSASSHLQHHHSNVSSHHHHHIHHHGSSTTNNGSTNANSLVNCSPNSSSHSNNNLNNTSNTNISTSNTLVNSNNNGCFCYGIDTMTSSATSNTNSVGSTFDHFETGHSRSNSSQTSSSRISTGFNSLPSHSRQGSADSESTTANARYQNEIKFNSVDRVGNKRNIHERTVKPVNGGLEDLFLMGPGKKAIDSTRVSADQLVQELLQTNELDESVLEEQPFISETNGGLELYVCRDGSATIGSRQSRPADIVSSGFAVCTNSNPKAMSRKLNRV